MAKMTLELGGKYTAGQTFSQAVGDIKKFGKETKDIGQVGTKVFDTITSKIEGPVSDAMGKMSGLVKGLASGGLWGLMSAAAGMAIGIIVEKLKEAQEQAKKFSEYMSDKFVTSIKKVNEEYANTKKEIDDVQKSAENAVNVLSGKAAADIANRVYQIHTEALQKVTDDMTEKGKAVVQAEAKLQEAQTKSAEMWWENHRKVEAAHGKMLSAEEKLASATETLAEAEKLKEDAEIKNIMVVSRRRAIQERIEQIEKQYEQHEITLTQYKESMGKILSAKAKFEEKNTTTLQNLDAIENEYKKAVANCEAAEREKEQALTAYKVAQYKSAESEAQHKQAIDEATAQQKKAAELLAKENKEKEELLARDKEQTEAGLAAQQLYNELMVEDIGISKQCQQLKLDEAYWIALYNNLRASGLSEEEAMIEMNKELKDYKKAEAFITKVCTELKVNEKEYMTEYLKLINEGMTEAEAYAELQNKLNEELKKRTEAEQKATKAAEGATGGKGKKDLADQLVGITVSLNNSDIGDMANKNEERFGFRGFERDQRQKAREERNARTQMKRDQAAAQRWLQGKMPLEQAKNWVDYAKKNFSPEQFRTLANMGAKGELLTPRSKEWQKQNDKVLAMERILDAAQKGKWEDLKTLPEIKKLLKTAIETK